MEDKLPPKKEDALTKSESVKAIKELKTEEILVKLNYLSVEDLAKAQAVAPSGDIVGYLLQEKKVTKDILGQAIAEYYALTYFDLNSIAVPKENYNLVDPSEAKHLRFIIVKQEKGLIEATTDNYKEVDEIKKYISGKFSGSKIKVYFSLKEDIDDGLKTYKGGLEKRLEKILNSEDPNFAAIYFDEIVREAVEEGASDIHMEPNIEGVLIRFRIDGVLHEMARISHEYYENLINRVKVLANIRLDEHYRTQDGAIRYALDDVPLDLRISIVPIMEGQKVEIRVLSDYIKNLALADLGMNDANFQLVDKASKKTYGMILTTGPTGSGKTTTLYSLLKLLNKSDVNITTIEDPVEYRIVGVNQIQVNPENEITFARGLRSIVRQDPNIILVGEIRDKETAEIAVNAALTGHLLLSTFHANNASTAIPRLLDMGIEPFLLASTLNLIVAQRLVRKVCQSCKYSREYSEAELKKLMPTTYKKYFKNLPARLYAGKGCPKCNYTGNKGRIGIFEMIYITEAIQDLILERASSNEIWKTAESEGAIKFFEDGLTKVISGDISLEELLRVAPVEGKDDSVYARKI